MLIGQGVYSFGDAARLTHLKQATIREWFDNRTTTKVGSVFISDHVGTQQKLISFLDLVDVFIAGKLRTRGITLQYLRKIYRTLQQDFGVEHPFGRHELLTDGKKVFLHGLSKQGREEVIEVLTRQKAFPEIILPFLKNLEYDFISNLATKWKIAQSVVLNPQICFGQPIVEARGIPTDVLAKAATSNSLKDVAAWYGVTVTQVRRAVTFEKKYLKAA